MKQEYCGNNPMVLDIQISKDFTGHVEIWYEMPCFLMHSSAAIMTINPVYTIIWYTDLY